MKRCSACAQSKPVKDFGSNKSKADGLQTVCIVCKSEYNKQYYVRNPNPLARREAADRLRAGNRRFVYDYLSRHPCVDCGTTDWRVLDFDHVAGEKLRDISKMINSNSLEILQAEVAKCVVRCRNCHALVTYERANSWRFWFK